LERGCELVGRPVDGKNAEQLWWQVRGEYQPLLPPVEALKELGGRLWKRRVPVDGQRRGEHKVERS
jgi:hypothetical protein